MELPQLSLNHAEADTMMNSIYAIIRETDTHLDIAMDTADTDAYVQSAYASHKLPGNLYIKQRDGYINCRDLVEDDISEVIIAAH